MLIARARARSLLTRLPRKNNAFMRGRRRMFFNRSDTFKHIVDLLTILIGNSLVGQPCVYEEKKNPIREDSSTSFFLPHFVPPLLIYDGKLKRYAASIDASIMLQRPRRESRYKNVFSGKGYPLRGDEPAAPRLGDSLRCENKSYNSLSK